MYKKILIVVVHIVQLCSGAFVTMHSSREELEQILLVAVEKGKSNSNLMMTLTDEFKGVVCGNILSSPIVAQFQITYFDKTFVGNAAVLKEMHPLLFNTHYTEVSTPMENIDLPSPAPFVLQPIYPLSTQPVKIAGGVLELNAFPCLVVTQNIINEIFLADAHLHKTYALITKIDPEEPELTLIGFAELAPLRREFENQLALEDLYMEELAAWPVFRFLYWEEDEIFINGVTTLSDNEKLKLCIMSGEAMGQQLEWVGISYTVVIFEHGPIKFTTLKEEIPEMNPEDQIIRGIECIETNINRSFMLIPSLVNQDGIFVMQYEDEASMIAGVGDVEVAPVDPTATGVGTSSSAAEIEPLLGATTSTGIPERTVVVVGYLEDISMYPNKKNKVDVVIYPTGNN